jgi:hypothetical protein
MNSPFPCSCGSPKCFRTIGGLKNQPAARQAEVLATATPAVVALAAAHKPADFVRGDVVVSGVSAFQLDGCVVVAAGRRFEHSCDPSLVLIEGRLCAMRAITADTALTVDMSLIANKIATPFDCTCGASQCVGRVSGFVGLSAARQDELMLLVEPDVRAEAAAAGYKVASRSALVDVKMNGGMGQAAFAAAAITKGTTLFECSGLAVPFITMYTICTGPGTHVLFGHAAECIAHSCDPNTRIVVTDEMGGTFNFEALRDVAVGELLSFNYMSTEWEMNCDFECLCGAATCFGRIHGLKNTPVERLAGVEPIASPLVKREIAAKLALQACGGYKRGEVVVAGVEATTMQIAPEGRFVVAAGRRFEHSCDPSLVLIEGRLIALREITASTAQTLDMSVLRYTLDAPFACKCGAACCVGTVGGFAALTRARQDELMLLVEPDVRVVAGDAGFKIASRSPTVDVRMNGSMGQATFAARAVATGESVFSIGGLVLPFATMYTICMTPTTHLLFGDGAQCLAHACDPNVRIVVAADAQTFEVVALRPIAADEIIAFNYLATEWEMNSPFPCSCGSPKCFRTIGGLKNQPAARQAEVLATATPAVVALAAPVEQ